ncbi:D-aminoacylase [Emcibacteraceae bacterium]|nr:D-aminoacylase [Emcibacteraceae bacterium]
MKFLKININSFKIIIILIILSSCTEQYKPLDKKSSSTWLIKNAIVYDGLGNNPVNTDIRINNGIISGIGIFDAQINEKIWNAHGLALAPGFIDPHSHHDTKLKKLPAPKSLLAQGITTIVSGLDGGASTFGDPFVSIANNFLVFKKNPSAINLAYFAPHDTYRELVMGDDFKRISTKEELEQMKKMLRRDMEAGALGLSTGLEYEPSLYSNTQEVIELAKVAAKYNGKYSSHIRSEDIKVTEAINEVLTIAREANIPANISHIKLAMYELHGEASKVIKALENARKEGLIITADIYPYDGWKAPMAILMPKRDYFDRAAAEYALSSIISPSGITISDYDNEPLYIGKTLKELATRENIDPIDLMMDLLQRAERDNIKERIIGRNINENDIQKFMEWPYTSITTDGGINDSHPRGQGSFSRVLASYVRDKNILSLTEAIRKMTSLPANSLGIANRGIIKKGYAADLVLFDPNAIQDHATFEKPLQYSTGIDAVWVNGELVWNKGRVTNARPGQIIRRVGTISVSP